MEIGDIIYVIIPLGHRRVRRVGKFRPCIVRAVQSNGNMSIRPVDRTHKWSLTVEPTMMSLKPGIFYKYLPLGFSTLDKAYAEWHNREVEREIEHENT